MSENFQDRKFWTVEPLHSYVVYGNGSLGRFYCVQPLQNLPPIFQSAKPSETIRQTPKKTVGEDIVRTA